MLKLKITWPLALLILVAIFAWMIKASEPARPSARQESRPRRTPRRRSPARNGHSARETFVIDVDPHPFDAAGGTNPDEYDAETERLDREAAEAARAAHSARQSVNPMPARNYAGAKNHD
jgi:hypothetical protein